MQIVARKVKELAEDPNNARTHDNQNIEAIKKSLEAFGQQKPIVINEEGQIVAGNGTLQAAQRLGWKDIQVVVTTLESNEATAYAIADNRTAELAAWDEDALAKTLSELQNDESINELAAGFSIEEIQSLQVPDFFPVDATDQSKLDEKNPTKCPECGHEWTE